VPGNNRTPVSKSIDLKVDEAKEDILIEFSVHELKQVTESKKGLFNITAGIDDIEDTLFYLSRIESIKIDGGFLVVHNKLTIDRLEKNNRIQYKESDYEKLGQYYQQKVPANSHCWGICKKNDP
jgi:ATP-dependent DNA helicase RecQ